jgi:hypothetical protein
MITSVLLGVSLTLRYHSFLFCLSLSLIILYFLLFSFFAYFILSFNHHFLLTSFLLFSFFRSSLSLFFPTVFLYFHLSCLTSFCLPFCIFPSFLPYFFLFSSLASFLSTSPSLYSSLPIFILFSPSFLRKNVHCLPH